MKNQPQSPEEQELIQALKGMVELSNKWYRVWFTKIQVDQVNFAAKVLDKFIKS